LLNHFPIIGTIIGIAMLVLGLVSRSNAIKRASLVLLFAMALMTVPVYLTGEPAEDRVENAIGVSKQILEEHEDTAKLTFAAMGLVGLVAFVVLIISFRASKYTNFGCAAALVVALTALGLTARTANLGGQIRHAEIRSGAMQTTGEKDQKRKRQEQDDDNN